MKKNEKKITANRVQVSDTMREMCPYPISSEGRLTLENNVDGDYINVTVGIEHEFKANLEPPVVETGYDDFVALINAVAADDMVAAQDAAKRIQHEVVEIKIPFDSIDTMSRDVSAYETTFIEKYDLLGYAQREEKTLALLNPSPGTITRMKKKGLFLPIVVVGMQYPKYVSLLRERMMQEEYSVTLIPVKGWKELPNYCFYTGMSADLAYHHRVESFIGFSLDPYSFVATGHDVLSSVETSYGTYLEYVRDKFVSTLTYYTTVECNRYATDAVAKWLSESDRMEKTTLNLWNIMASGDVDIPPIMSSNPYFKICPSIDVEYYNVDGITIEDITEENVSYKCYLAMNNSGKYGKTVLDVVSPLDRDGRDKILGYLESRGHILSHMRPKNLDDFTYARSPNQSAPFYYGSNTIRVDEVKTTTECISYICENRDVISPEVIRVGLGYILKKDVSMVQPCNFKKIGTKYYIGDEKISSFFEMTHLIKGAIAWEPGKGHDEFDFIKKVSSKSKFKGKAKHKLRDRKIDVALLKLLDELKPLSIVPDKVKIQGYYPSFGKVPAADLFYESQAFKFSKTGRIHLIQGEGPIHDMKGNKYVVHAAKSMRLNIELNQMFKKKYHYSKSSYMAMTGANLLITRSAHLIIDEEAQEGIEIFDDI
jgi:hypothetical protein